MSLLALEHSKAAYRADFALYGCAVALLSAVLLWHYPTGRAGQLIVFMIFGLCAWTALECALHRFVLHGVAPFQRWHAEHHERPKALIGTPTILSAALFGMLVFLPTVLLGNLWRASALTLGLLLGYLFYATTHHAIHHWHGDSKWLRRRKRWHAHHHRGVEPVCYGVTSSFWDRVFCSSRRVAKLN
jgi:sterol desaturase/sphingolipid hydroxylase (fatty acid hydroxylase superfamily)